MLPMVDLIEILDLEGSRSCSYSCRCVKKIIYPDLLFLSHLARYAVVERRICVFGINCEDNK